VAASRDAPPGAGGAGPEAAATKSVSDAIEAGSGQAINYFVAQKYVEALGKFATSPNAKTILFPVEATQLMGTLGGIGELAREVFGETASKSPTAPRQKVATVASRGAPPGLPGVPRVEG
jgi:hypothetical protein